MTRRANFKLVKNHPEPHEIFNANIHECPNRDEIFDAETSEQINPEANEKFNPQTNKDLNPETNETLYSK